MAAKTRLSLDGYGARRAGSFAGRAEEAVPAPTENYYSRHVQAAGRRFQIEAMGRDFRVKKSGRNWRVTN